MLYNKRRLVYDTCATSPEICLINARTAHALYWLPAHLLMSGRARATRRLRGAVRKGARRNGLNKPVPPMTDACAARFADALDPRWFDIAPLPSAAAGEQDARVSLCDGEINADLSHVLGTLEDEFTASGRAYAAVAAADARRKLHTADSALDSAVGFHPALWAHIRRIEKRMANPSDL